MGFFDEILEKAETIVGGEASELLGKYDGVFEEAKGMVEKAHADGKISDSIYNAFTECVSKKEAADSSTDPATKKDAADALHAVMSKIGETDEIGDEIKDKIKEFSAAHGAIGDVLSKLL